MPLSIVKKPSSGNRPPRWQPRSRAARHKLDAVERIMARFQVGPPMRDKWEETGMLNLWEEAREPIREALAIEPSGRGYRDLGAFYLRSCDYKKAIAPLTRALKISPTSTNLKVGLQQARLALHITAWAQRLLPRKQQAGKVFPFPVKGRRLWAVLSAERTEYHSENARISVFEEHGSRLSLRWRSELIKSIEHREYFTADLWAFPMTRSKVPELVFMGVCGGGSANPSLMQIYHWTGRTFRQVLDADSEQQPLWIEDLHHTGRYQVRCVHLVGKDLSHGEQIRWACIYDWNGAQYVKANKKYLEAFDDTKAEALYRLQHYPQDPALLKYLAMEYRQEGRRRQALIYLHRMERACVELVKNDPNDVDSWWNLGDSAEQTGRRARAAECFGKVQRISRALAKKESNPDGRDYYLRYAKNASKRLTALHQPAK